MFLPTRQKTNVFHIIMWMTNVFFRESEKIQWQDNQLEVEIIKVTSHYIGHPFSRIWCFCSEKISSMRNTSYMFSDKFIKCKKFGEKLISLRWTCTQIHLMCILFYVTTLCSSQSNQMIKKDIELVDWPWSFEGHL